MEFFTDHQKSLFSICHRGLIVCLAFVAGVLIFAGCSKKASVQAAPAAAKDSTAAPAEAQPDVDATLSQLTQALRKYSFEHERVPASVGELFTTGNAGSMPAAPAGKKFVIEPKTLKVVLANQ